MLLKNRSPFFLVGLMALLLVASVARAQESSRKRLHSPATVRGLVGGESQDHYVIRARKGQTIIVQISWRREGDNQASFGVAAAAGDDEQVPGKESDNGKRWTGKIRKTGDYVISVVAHPSAQYKLKVTVK